MQSHIQNPYETLNSFQYDRNPFSTLEKEDWATKERSEIGTEVKQHPGNDDSSIKNMPGISKK